jgi:hypothetical protein
MGDSPLKLNPVPVAAAAEIVRLDPPELVSVSDKLELLPSCTLPNPRLVGFAVSVPGAMPVPDSARFTAGLEALEVKATLPLELPVD